MRVIAGTYFVYFSDTVCQTTQNVREEEMRPLVIYHANCADGFAAAFAAWLKLGDDAEYVPMQYGKDDVFKIPPWTARDVYILDFSLPRDYMDKIFSEAKRVVWLDHHASSRPIAEEL